MNAMKIEDDPILGTHFDTPEKKARWMRRISRLYLLWLVFMIAGLTVILLSYFFK